VLISHNERQIAFSNSKGAIGIVTDVENVNHEIAVAHLEGADNYATCFCWTDDDKDLYCGDKKGNVSLLQFTQFMVRVIKNELLSSCGRFLIELQLV
jgi:hypothetical protein